MNEQRIFNKSNQLEGNKLPGWYRMNKNNVALKVSNSNLNIKGEIRFNTDTNNFEGYNGVKWITFNCSKGDQGPPGKDYDKIINIINLKNQDKQTIENKHKLTSHATLFSKIDNTSIGLRSLISEKFNINDIFENSLTFSQDEHEIKIDTIPKPYIWDLTNINIKELSNNRFNTDKSLKAYGTIKHVKLETTYNINAGQIVCYSLDEYDNICVKPFSFDSKYEPNFFNHPLTIAGVCLNNKKGTDRDRTIKVCSQGITSVIVTNKGYLTCESEIEMFSNGILNDNGYVIKINRRPITNFIKMGEFLESSKELNTSKNTNLITFNVNPTIYYD